MVVWQCVLLGLEPTLADVPTPSVACVLAQGDASALGVDARHYRWFLTYDTTPEFYGAFSYVLNSVPSKSPNIYRPTIVANGHLIRVDLRKLWPRKNDYDKFLVELEKLTLIEPYFHTLGTLEIVERKQSLVKTEPYQLNGKTYTQKWVEEVKVLREEKGSEFALHLGGLNQDFSSINSLSLLTQSQLPIMRADWFIFLMLTQDPLENGQYYNFANVEKSRDGKTAEQLWFESQGVDYNMVKNLRSDQRIAKFRGDITGQTRAIEIYPLLVPSARIGPGYGFSTRDWFKGQVDPKRHPIKNLLGYKEDGSEHFGFNPNGTLRVALFDAKGERVDIAPDKLATDHKVPEPHLNNLQPMISCLRCHGPTEMFIDAQNDVLALTKGKFGLNIFDDTDDGQTPEDAIDRLAGLYGGEMDESIRIARNTHSKATFLATGGMSIIDVTKKISDIYAQYRYEPVTPSQACLELGVTVGDKDAVDKFQKLVPNLPKNRFGISPESPVVGALKVYSEKHRLKVTRNDWEHEYSDIMLRSLTRQE